MPALATRKSAEQFFNFDECVEDDWTTSTSYYSEVAESRKDYHKAPVIDRDVTPVSLLGFWVSRNTSQDIISEVTDSDKYSEVFQKAKDRIEKLCQKVNDPDAPNETAQTLALMALDYLWSQEVTPSLINPSGDEGLFFEFFVKDKYYLFKFCNSGEIVFLKRIPGQLKTVKEINIQQLEEATKEITSAYRTTDV